MAYSKEKLEFLRQNTTLSPISLLKLRSLQKNGTDIQKVLEEEYDMRLTSYAKRWQKEWTRQNWGEREGESLQAFAEGFVGQGAKDIERKSR